MPEFRPIQIPGNYPGEHHLATSFTMLMHSLHFFQVTSINLLETRMLMVCSCLPIYMVMASSCLSYHHVNGSILLESVHISYFFVTLQYQRNFDQNVD